MTGRAIICALLCSGGLSAQEPGLGPPPPPAAPDLEVPVLEQDWGSVRQGVAVTHSFTVRNRGVEPLRILKVHSNCGCTSTFFTEEIAAGGEGQVELRIDTAKLAGGTHRKNATVTTNDPDTPQVDLWLRGEVVPLLVTDAPLLKVTGICEEPKEGRFRFTPGTDLPTEVRSARLDGGLLEVVAVTPIEGGGAEVHLRAGTAAEAAMIRDELRLEVRLGEGEAAETVETTFAVVIEHLDRVRITPGGIVLFHRRHTAPLYTDPARRVTREIQVRSERADLPVRVTGVRIEDAPEGVFAAEVRAVIPGEHYIIEVRVLRTVEESQVSGRLVIEIDDPIRPTREREVVAQFRLKSPAG